MLVGIMGGTFDPIHTGHLIAAERARVEAGLDEVWLMPANVPPHKSNAPKATTQQRWEMVCLAAEGNPFFRPIDIEISKGGVSYSIDTIQLLRKQYPTTEFAYIIGADMVQYLPQWHRIDDIVRHIRFIGLARPGYELDMAHMSANIRERVTIVPMPLVEISSTAIREERRQERSVRYLVPEVVNGYMEVNRLYEA
ncbi:nicotinate-nucleotide adenylyltransferase [Paenibacillus sp. CGMCC 1.16610]|uniref:Probable nicotinate-nucleotide adenylyltransferase n=1 Tax=Paenibacillus anseongense TaxID=2682845 RepID=A0ABW9UFV6_9BACL|nr:MULTISPECIES: nicotinate-nucleotide adenylyltransferase [Paenibacillus]MBA2938227.1 nicotinate-nucleotide adenylyltransferase [Paenibacillus sp. CGMCC 1.16610]MVQ37285.1 nicotinate-nucleotide adenylyltransferase [Paenibacillus anseongense]